MVERYTATNIIHVHVPTPHHTAKPTLSFSLKTHSMSGPGNQCHALNNMHIATRISFI